MKCNNTLIILVEKLQWNTKIPSNREKWPNSWKYSNCDACAMSQMKLNKTILYNENLLKLMENPKKKMSDALLYKENWSIAWKYFNKRQWYPQR